MPNLRYVIKMTDLVIITEKFVLIIQIFFYPIVNA